MAQRSAIGPIILEELRRPVGFVVALGVGVVLTLSKRFEALAAVLPFAVPFLVGLFTRVAARFATRHQDRLLKLPALRRDPAFIIDHEGSILAATGTTQRLFEELRVTHVDQFLSLPDGGSALSEILNRGAGDRGQASGDAAPLYAPTQGIWYRLQVNRDATDDILIWLTDVTVQVQLEQRRNSLKEFTSRLQRELQNDAIIHDDDRRLADLLLSEGYEAIMLARISDESTVGIGTLYHSDGRDPAPVRFAADSEAPIVRSRKEGRAIWATEADFAARSDFHTAFPILPEVREFVGTPIRNLANYHSGDVSIIAFNRSGDLTAADIGILESVADTAVTAFSLLDLAHRADNRFIQSIHGICAAAEYSDELTGSHIWRVNDYSRILAESLGFPEDDVLTIGTVAAMHDIGKVAIPHIIKLPRALDPLERREMQMHTIYGAQIIDRMRRATSDADHRLDMAYQIALHHHQRWNGSGYPKLIGDGGELTVPGSRDAGDYVALRAPVGEEIPPAARIVAMADMYDALRSARQYKGALSHEEAVAIIRHDDRSGYAGHELFGADVFETFMDQQDRLSAVFDQG